MLAVHSGNLQTAISYWSKYIKQHPDSYEALVNRGLAYFISGAVLKGVSDWHEARRFTPPFAYAYNSVTFLRRSPADGKLLGYVVSLELDPDFTASIIMVGSLYQEIGKARLASELFMKSKELTKNPLLKSQFEHWVKLLDSTK